jgi:hypothetical protein
LISRRAIHGPQDSVPGLFVTPDLEVAKRFGICVVAIEVDVSDLSVPPAFAIAGADLAASLNNPLEPQAFLSKRVEPAHVKVVYVDETRL